jgi:hypothetical protein
MGFLARTLLCCLLVIGPSACAEGEESSQVSSPLELTAGGACGDVFFWAATESGDAAVTVRVDAVDRSTTDDTVRQFVLPDPEVSVEVLKGGVLTSNFCNDVISTSSEPVRRYGVVAGEGSIRLDPALRDPVPYGHPPVRGELELTGLVAEDGTAFAPIRVTSDWIGSQSG